MAEKPFHIEENEMTGSGVESMDEQRQSATCPKCEQTDSLEKVDSMVFSASFLPVAHQMHKVPCTGFSCSSCGSAFIDMKAIEYFLKIAMEATGVSEKLLNRNLAQAEIDANKDNIH